MVWEVKKLGEVCEVLDSKRKPITKRDRIEGKYPYYGATGILDYVHEYIFDEKLILIGEDGAKWGKGENTSFIAEGKYWVNNHAHVIRPNRKVVLDNWIIYFLNSSDLSKYVTGLTVPKLNQEKMKSIALPIPPLPIQKQIVAILDKAFEKISKAKENAEKNLNNAKETFESSSERIICDITKGLKKQRLGEFCEKITQGPNPKLRDITPEGNNFVLKTKDFYDHIVLYENCLQINGKLINEWKRFVLQDMDIIIGLVGVGSIGKCNIFREQSNKNYIFTRATGLIRVNQKYISPLYLRHYLTSPIGKSLIKKGIGGTTGQLVIKTSYFKDVKIPIPSLKQQKQIVSKLDKLSQKTKSLEKIYTQKLRDLEELKQSILQKAFKGELTKG